MTNDIGWELYRTLLAVLREGSLSAAARTLGITQPTAGRQIAALESALGVVLFTRSPQGLIATEVAIALRSQAEAMANLAAAIQRGASEQGEAGRGTVRIAASEIVGTEVLPPILAQLQDRYPKLKLELVLSNALQDLLQREADIAVRMTAPKQQQLVQRHLGQIRVGLFAHPDYLQRHGCPASLDALSDHRVIGFDTETSYLRGVRQQVPFWSRERFSLRCDNDAAQLALIRAGAGIGACQIPLARRSPQLQRVLADQLDFRLDTWITMHEDLRQQPRCRLVFDALATGLADYITDAR